jgi:hypothetical protein
VQLCFLCAKLCKRPGHARLNAFCLSSRSENTRRASKAAAGRVSAGEAAERERSGMADSACAGFASRTHSDGWLFCVLRLYLISIVCPPIRNHVKSTQDGDAQPVYALPSRWYSEWRSFIRSHHPGIVFTMLIWLFRLLIISQYVAVEARSQIVGRQFGSKLCLLDRPLPSGGH